jgi:hypothetical protein
MKEVLKRIKNRKLKVDSIRLLKNWIEIKNKYKKLRN